MRGFLREEDGLSPDDGEPPLTLFNSLPEGCGKEVEASEYVDVLVVVWFPAPLTSPDLRGVFPENSASVVAIDHVGFCEYAF